MDLGENRGDRKKNVMLLYCMEVKCFWRKKSILSTDVVPEFQTLADNGLCFFLAI